MAKALSQHDREILAYTLLGEASSEGKDGMAAVMHVIKNRAESGVYPESFSKVALQHRGGVYQFSTWSPAHGNNPEQKFSKNSESYKTALQAIDEVLGGAPDPTGKALNYLNPDIATPSKWFKASATAGTTKIGKHLFASTEKPGVLAAGSIHTPADAMYGVAGLAGKIDFNQLVMTPGMQYNAGGPAMVLDPKVMRLTQLQMASTTQGASIIANHVAAVAASGVTGDAKVAAEVNHIVAFNPMEVPKQDQFGDNAMGMLPPAVRTFAATVMGDRSQIHSTNFTKPEIQALESAILNAENDGRNIIVYSDYGKDTIPGADAGPFTSVSQSMANTIGMAKFRRDPDGTLHLTDQYDWNSNSSDGVRDFTRALSKGNVAGMLEGVGAIVMPEGSGRPVNMTWTPTLRRDNSPDARDERNRKAGLWKDYLSTLHSDSPYGSYKDPNYGDFHGVYAQLQQDLSRVRPSFTSEDHPKSNTTAFNAMLHDKKVSGETSSNIQNVAGQSPEDKFRDSWYNSSWVAGANLSADNIGNAPTTTRVQTIPIHASTVDAPGGGPSQQGFDLIQRALKEGVVADPKVAAATSKLRIDPITASPVMAIGRNSSGSPDDRQVATQLQTHGYIKTAPQAGVGEFQIPAGYRPAVADAIIAKNVSGSPDERKVAVAASNATPFHNEWAPWQALPTLSPGKPVAQAPAPKASPSSSYTAYKTEDRLVTTYKTVKVDATPLGGGANQTLQDIHDSREAAQVLAAQSAPPTYKKVPVQTTVQVRVPVQVERPVPKPVAPVAAPVISAPVVVAAPKVSAPAPVAISNFDLLNQQGNYAPGSPNSNFEKDNGMGSVTKSMAGSSRWNTGY